MQEEYDGQMSIYDVLHGELGPEIAHTPLERIRRDLYARLLVERWGNQPELVMALMRERFGPA